MTEIVSDPELAAAVKVAIDDLHRVIPSLGHHPAPMALALLFIGVSSSYSSGFITKEDLMGQVELFWEQHKPTNLN